MGSAVNSKTIQQHRQAIATARSGLKDLLSALSSILLKMSKPGSNSTPKLGGLPPKTASLTSSESQTLMTRRRKRTKKTRKDEDKKAEREGKEAEKEGKENKKIN